MAAGKKRQPPGAGTWDQQVRLIAGLVLFTFVSTHFLNHALGNISFAWMQWGQDVRYEVWHSKVGGYVFYGALITHVLLALIKIARRRTWRMPIWEAGQIALGLTIPYFLLHHIVMTRGAELTFKSYIDYQHELTVLWPENALFQSTLLVLVWTHACIGLHFWLRMKRWYSALQPYLAISALALPLLALTGWISAARRQVLEGKTKNNITPEQLIHLDNLVDQWRAIVYGLVLLAFLIPILITLIRWGRGGITVTYPDAKVVKTPAGPTLLEISRIKNIPHMSVCGGRARCSTCRTLILEGASDLPKPSATETKVLGRIGATQNVRLACQVRPANDLSVRPLFNRGQPLRKEAIHDRYRWGVEQPVAVMFIDLRGFTTLSEGKLPFDVVFILNRYVDGVAGIIRKNGGVVDKVMGDGIMALFGVETTFEEGARSALNTLCDVMEELAEINRDLNQHLSAPLRIAVGLHGGPVILGRIGLDNRAGASASLTALGDVVNVAARLEGTAKQESAVAAISREILSAAGIATDALGAFKDIAVRGRTEPLQVACPKTTGPIRQALDTAADATANNRFSGQRKKA